MKKLLSILLAAVLCLGLCACGGLTAEGPASEAAEAAEVDVPASAAPETDYTSKPLPLPEGVTAFSAVAVTADGIYLCDGGGALYALDTDGEVLDSFHLAVGDGAVADMTEAGDGTLWIMTTPKPDPAQPHPVNSLCRFDAGKGQVLDSFDLPSTGEAPTAVCADGTRRRLYVSTGSELLALDYDGNVLFRLSGPVYSTAIASDGTVWAMEVRVDTVDLLSLDFDGQRWEQRLSFVTQSVDIYDGGQGYDLLVGMGSTLYSLDADSLSLTPLLDLDLANVLIPSDAFVLPEGRFLLEDVYGPTLYLARPGGGDGPVTITVAVLDQSVLNPMVVAFNNSQDQYRVVLKDYAEQYNDKSNYYYDTAGLEQLGLDIASGDGPDILALDQLPVYQYMRDSLLEDLYPYIDADPDIDRADLDEGLLAALETDGALYELATAVQIPSIITAPGVLDEQRPVTWSGILQALGENAFAGNGSDGLLSTAVGGDGSPFIDWEQNTCDFENDEFLSLLALAKGAEQPESPDAAPSILMHPVFAGAALALNCQDLGLDGEVPVLWGLPGRDGSRYLLSPLIDFAICAQSEHKDGAWAFLRTFITEPSTAWLGHYLTKGVQTDPSMYPPVSVPDSYLAQLDEAADAAFAAANGVAHDDTAAVNILREEAAPYLAGQSTAEEAAANIQNRMSLYLSERS